MVWYGVKFSGGTMATIVTEFGAQKLLIETRNPFKRPDSSDPFKKSV